ncbi:cytochrome c-type biogenesis protein CcmH [Blastococcus sp. KM273129]|uniref:cytochrome c-type biogenesis protein CcmH n=1 Tax=Blastococcus sp. KM273129 TaxID=2570315 RepID=UPI001F1E299A|nr:cytochrome c-type biogenesis protein CcmH [Blastococcus sp. KM273129]MCF6735625.1 tetratricopeptide repeat protein [Blastococcus sp. KM273129]
MSARLRVAAVVLAALALVAALWWRQEPAPRTDPAEAAREIATGLRCPTCAGESAADSAAPAARGMRAVIAERVAAGETPEEIRAHFVTRYGEWILLDPPREGVGWALVVLPGVALLGGVVAVGVLVTRRRPTARPALTPAERAAAEAAVAAALGRRDRLTGSGDDERLEAALQLLDDVRSGSRSGGPAQAAEDEVLAEVLRITSAEPSPREAPAGRDGAPSGAAPARARLPRPAVLLPVVAVAVVGTVAAVAVPRALAPAAAGSEEVGVPAGREGAAADDLAGELLRQARALDDEGRFAEAATAYRAVLEERPEDLAVALSLAFALLRDDRPGEAVPLVRTVLDAVPEHPEALLMLGSAEHALGDPAADATLRRFLELAPGHPAADAVRDLLGEA